MQIPILSGIYTTADAPDLRVNYPLNWIPVAKDSGISAGYLRPADGIVQFGTGVGIDRGGINWNGVCYRVMGTKLVSIDSNGASTVLGDVDGSTPVTMDYSFDRLAIASAGKLYYWNGTTLTQVTDVDLGTVVDFCWVDGYFLTTDGTYLIVTELNDPLSVNPLKYGSSEADPDPVKAVLKLRNEIYALNRYTIEVFENTGGANFPFSRISGGQIQKGTIGTHSCCVFMDAIAFLGGGRNESPSIWVGVNGNTNKISTTDIDFLLQSYTEEQLASVIMEARTDRGHQMLYIHLPDQTLVFDGGVSKVLDRAVWFTLSSGLLEKSIYKARNFVWCYNKWLVGDPTSNNHGYLTQSLSSHYGQPVGWEFNTAIIYNETNGAVFHKLELVCLSGRNVFGSNPQIWTQYSLDGVQWSMEKSINIGLRGDRLKPMAWFQQGTMRRWRVQRFRGTSDSFMAVARLEATIEPLAF